MVGWGRGLVVNRNKGCQIFNMKKFLKLQKKEFIYQTSFMFRNNPISTSES